MKTLETDVLIVGAGPAGLTAAALLARSGVDAITCTKYRTATSPRAHITNQRAVEVFRDLGIEDQVQARALPHERMGTQVFATSFAGRELSRKMTWGTGDDRISDYRSASPSEMCNIAQHVLEPILLRRAQELGADVRLDHEVVSVADLGESVRAVVAPRDGSETFTIEAKWVLGCDGAHSVVARDGEFDFTGEAAKGHAVTVWIEADLSAHTAHRPGALFFTVTPWSEDFVTVWTCVEPYNEWSTILLRPDLEEVNTDSASIAATVSAAIGDETPFAIKKVSPWEFKHVVATGYRQGRLLIAGDAAHRHPPANGLGSNTSIQDAYNLAWKIAAVVRHQAGPQLLDSYSQERQPVGKRVVDRANQSVVEMGRWFGPLGLQPDMTPGQAEDRLNELSGPAGEADRAALFDGLDLLDGQFNALGVELGQHYSSGAVLSEPGVSPQQADVEDLFYRPSTSPGSPLPHCWVVREQRDVSILDVCDYDAFTLIVGADSRCWLEAAEALSADFGVEISAVPVTLGAEFDDIYGAWHRKREIGDSGALLVRPDRVIAWRAMSAPADPTGELRGALGQILQR